MKTVVRKKSMDSHSVPEHRKADHPIQTLEKELRVKYEFDSIIGRHPTMVEILKSVSQVADTNATVLIQSESGTDPRPDPCHQGP